MERKCWHPVLYARELKDKPISVSLCDEAVVLWRERCGTVNAVSDLCIHRGTALSLGKVCNDKIYPPITAGATMERENALFIPQLPSTCPIPQKAKLNAYYCQERYGLIWVSLEEPQFPLPEVEEFSLPEWKMVQTGPFRWLSSSARQTENFTDFAHFPFVHPELLGDPSRTLVPPHKVKREGNVLIYEIIRPEAPNSEEFPIFANPTNEQPMRHNRYRLYLPYTIVLKVAWPGTMNGMLYFFTSQPVSKNECIGYCIVAKNYGSDDAETLQRFEELIFAQDQAVVESQRPHQVPFDLAEEIHLPFDAVAIAYRKAMQEFEKELEKELGFKT